MRKKRNIGKRLAMATIILAFAVVIMGILLFHHWLANRTTGNQETIATAQNIRVVQASDIYYDNYWSKAIVTNIVEEDVPIPEGVEYVQGTKETGVIVKENTSGNYLLWIPYDESVTEEGLEGYYQNCEYVPMEVDTLESIAHYGGFYVTLEESDSYETLKQIENEAYAQAYEQAQSSYEQAENVQSHLISKTELAQVLDYRNKIGSNVEQTKTGSNTGYTIQKTANTEGESTVATVLTPSVTSVTIRTYDASYSEETTAIAFDKEEVVIPEGFAQVTFMGGVSSSNKDTGVNTEVDSDIVLKICDITNPNLRYVWVPVSRDEFTQANSKLREYYEEVDTEYGFEEAKDAEGEEYQELLNSIETYGGFYIAEAELGYDASGNTINKARGMKMVEETGWGMVNQGEYYRGTEIKTYEKAVKLASSVHNENSNVVSHLMYGAEWDATMLWLLDTKGEEISKEDIIVDSTDVTGAKYEGTMKLDENGNLEDDDLQGLNGIYGLAGNLVEVTQESVTQDGTSYCVARGGSYEYSANMYPMASRMRFPGNSIAQEEIGIRNCLLIHLENPSELEKKEEKVTTSQKEEKDTIKEEDLNALDQIDYINIKEEKLGKASVKRHEGKTGIVKQVKFYDTTYTWYAQNEGPWIDLPYWDDAIWNNGCGPTSVATVMSGRGWNWNPAAVVTYMQNDLGINYTNANNLEIVLHNKGIGTWYQTGDSGEKIKNYIKGGNNKPVIVCVQKGSDGYFTGGGHIMPLLAANDTDFFVANPNTDSPSGWISINKVMQYVYYEIYCGL